MTKHYRNHNIRFNMTDEGGVQAWERLHSAEVEQDFKSQNAFVVAAINDYYERHLAKKNDPYLESREKEDAFADRLVQTVEQKLLSNLPALAAMYQMQQQGSWKNQQNHLPFWGSFPLSIIFLTMQRTSIHHFYILEAKLSLSF